MSKFKVINNETFEKLLEFYKYFDSKIKPYWINIYLYGSLSYLYYSWDENIVVWDIDLITKEENYSKIIELFKDEKEITCELTDHNSVRLFKDWAKLSIHSLELATKIADFTKNIENIEINWVIFKSLWFSDIIKFYKKWSDYENPRKIWYKNKFNNLLEKYYESNYTFFILKPSSLSRKSDNWKLIYQEIEDYIIENWFTIEDKREVILLWDDIEYLYRDEYEKLWKILGQDDINKAIEINKKLYTNQKVIILIVKWNDAINKADYLKWNSYWPMKCREDSIRYIFRDKQFDDFDFPIGKIVDVPCDNIVHCPKDFYEFSKVLVKWFL